MRQSSSAMPLAASAVRASGGRDRRGAGRPRRRRPPGRRPRGCAADLLDGAWLGGSAVAIAPSTSSSWMRLRARGSAAEALAAPLRRECDPDGGGEGGRDDRERDERPASRLRGRRSRPCRRGRAAAPRRDQEEQAGREGQRRALEAALAPPGAEQEQAEPEPAPRRATGKTNRNPRLLLAPNAPSAEPRCSPPGDGPRHSRNCRRV